MISHWTGELPICPLRLAKKLGITVNPTTHPTFTAHAYMEQGKRFIEYNAAESMLRQRFAIAHALGHHALRHINESRSYTDSVANFRFDLASSEDIQANQFATELLIPELVVRYFIVKKGVTLLNELANLFSVSTVVVQYRLKHLGLL